MKIKAISRGNVSELYNENNDCTVRALSNAADIDYSKAHHILSKHGRKDRNGAYFTTMLKAYTEAGFKLNSVHGTTHSARHASNESGVRASRGITLAKILPYLDNGRYIVNTTGHAVAVVNSQIIDTYDNQAGKRVIAVFKKL